MWLTLQAGGLCPIICVIENKNQTTDCGGLRLESLAMGCYRTRSISKLDETTKEESSRVRAGSQPVLLSAWCLLICLGRRAKDKWVSLNGRNYSWRTSLNAGFSWQYSLCLDKIVLGGKQSDFNRVDGEQKLLRCWILRSLNKPLPACALQLLLILGYF